MAMLETLDGKMKPDPVLLPASCVDDVQKIVHDLEAELSGATARRAIILEELAKTMAAITRGDQKARFYQVQLNKEDAAAGRLISSITNQIAAARKRLQLFENQVAAGALKRAQLDAAAVPHDRLFEVETPDGRRVRHRHANPDTLRWVLQPGYQLVAEVLGAGVDGKGGLVEPIGQRSTMEILLAAHGSELLEFLGKHGIIGSTRQLFAVIPET
jgi:hypothetical protein